MTSIDALRGYIQHAEEVGRNGTPAISTGELADLAAELLSAIASRQAVVPLSFERKTAISAEFQRLYDEGMRSGKHGHYETMFGAMHQAYSTLAAPVRDETEIRAAALEEAATVIEQERINAATLANSLPPGDPNYGALIRLAGMAGKLTSAIRALSQTSKPEGDEASINIDRLKRGDFTPDSFDEHDNDDPGDTP